MPPRRAPATPGNSITCTMVGSLSQQARSDIFNGVGSLSAFSSLSPCLVYCGFFSPKIFGYLHATLKVFLISHLFFLLPFLSSL